eukprot:TRINITY_DN3327_c0_g1_i1.p1 TRINITY_DN3327_c0_g1~~TRINITY_DN3327_c0_g1_i1.p1  ORF type:complete len:104 (+),score=11.85 TRINITY_DN3327_c0_g1_i1:49-360(+)
MPTTLALIYFAIVNLAAVYLFKKDKTKAEQGKWRIDEFILLSTALIGGWLGGAFAMSLFRHKTIKKGFREEYQRLAAVNCVLVLAVVMFLVVENLTRVTSQDL